MTPYVQAQMQALKEGFFLLEAAVTQPLSLTHDLRALREALFPETDDAVETPQQREARLGLMVSRPPATQGLTILSAVTQAIAALTVLDALDARWVERAGRVLPRVQARLGQEARAALARKFRGLYVIVDPQVARRDAVNVAEAVLMAGACAIQLRDKAHDKGDQLPVARRLAELCNKYSALLIINDHADLAAASGAHGLHVGQHDLPLAEARRILSPEQLIGRSNATLDEAVESHAAGADYVAVGTIYPTGTKEKTRPAGLETLRRVREVVEGPVVAIGGINESNVEPVIAAGADAVAVISAVVAADDPGQAAKRLVEKIQEALAKRGS